MVLYEDFIFCFVQNPRWPLQQGFVTHNFIGKCFEKVYSEKRQR